MQQIVRRIVPGKWSVGRAALAGAIATAAYSVAMEGDQYITGNRFSDVKFIQGLLGDKEAKRVGAAGAAWGIHFLNGILLGQVYAAVFRRLLPGPEWLKGLIFGEVFIVSAWWLTPMADRYHPLIQAGRLPRLATWSSFWQNIVRHLVFGVVLGVLYKEHTR